MLARVRFDGELEWLLEFTKAEAAGVSKSAPPAALLYLWNWFLELRAVHGSEPVKPSEIESWARLKMIDIEPFEATALIQMDIAFRANFPKKK